MYNLWRFVALNDSKISFVAINAVLSRIFCRNLRAFVWRKFVPKIVCVEKNDKYLVCKQAGTGGQEKSATDPRTFSSTGHRCRVVLLYDLGSGPSSGSRPPGENSVPSPLRFTTTSPPISISFDHPAVQCKSILLKLLIICLTSSPFLRGH